MAGPLVGAFYSYNSWPGEGAIAPLADWSKGTDLMIMALVLVFMAAPFTAAWAYSLDLYLKASASRALRR